MSMSMSGTLKNMSMPGTQVTPLNANCIHSIDDTLMKLPSFYMDEKDDRVIFRDFYVKRLSDMGISTVRDMALLHESLCVDGSRKLRTTWRQIALKGGYLTLDYFFYVVDCAFEVYQESKKAGAQRMFQTLPRKHSPSCFAPILGVDGTVIPLPPLPTTSSTTTVTSNCKSNLSLPKPSNRSGEAAAAAARGALHKASSGSYIGIGCTPLPKNDETTAPLPAVVATTTTTNATTASANTIPNASTTKTLPPPPSPTLLSSNIEIKQEEEDEEEEQDPLQRQRFLMEQQMNIQDQQREMIRIQSNFILEMQKKSEMQKKRRRME